MRSGYRRILKAKDCLAVARVKVIPVGVILKWGVAPKLPMMTA